VASQPTPPGKRAWPLDDIPLLFRDAPVALEQSSHLFERLIMPRRTAR
jgi:hypothetical protein